MQIGCCTSIENIELLDWLGYDFIDLPGACLADMEEGEFEQLRQKLCGNRLNCLGFHASIPARIRITGGDEQANRVYLQRLISRGKLINVRYIGIGSPNSRSIPQGYSVEKADQQMLHFLEVACKMAGDGITILLESLNSTETNYINSVSQAAELVGRSDYANMGLVLDMYHFLMEDEKVDVLSDQLLQKVHYVHIADPQNRGFPTLERIDVFEQVVKRLNAFGYNGAISIEAITNSFNTDAESGLQAIKALYGKY